MVTNTEVTAHPSLRDQVARILEAEIRKNAYPQRLLPGVRVLAQRFGVSTMTITGALDALEALKLIERVKGKGVFIRDKRGRTAKLAPRVRQVGVFCHSTPERLAEDSYNGEIWTGLLDSAARSSLRLTVVGLGQGGEAAQVRRALAEMPLEGGVLLGLTDRAALLRLERLRLPLVLADAHFEGVATDCVTLDSRQGSLAAVRHLLELGHREIGLVTSPRVADNPERWEGFRAGLAAAGLDPDRAFVRSCEAGREQGHRLMKEALAGGVRLPSALYVWCGPVAGGIAGALRESGVRVPQDVSVVACASRRFMRWFPEITAVVADGVAVGTKAVELLHRRIEDPEARPQTVRLPMPLEVRASSGRPGPAR